MENVVKIREDLLKIRNKLKGISKAEITEKIGSEEATNVKEDLKYAFEYADEALRSLASVDMLLAHLNVFLNSANNK